MVVVEVGSGTVCIRSHSKFTPTSHPYPTPNSTGCTHGLILSEVIEPWWVAYFAHAIAQGVDIVQDAEKRRETSRYEKGIAVHGCGEIGGGGMMIVFRRKGRSHFICPQRETTYRLY